MAKENTKIMSMTEINGMVVNVGENTVKLVGFIPANDKQYIDVSVNVADDYKFPKKAVNGVVHPAYFVCSLNVTFAKDVKNVTAGDKEERKAKNAEIMENAVGFKAVCRDLTKLAGNNEKGFLKMTASMPCDEKINVNGSITGLWVFTSKVLRDEFLKMVRNGINSGKYHLYTGEKKQKELKKVRDIATVMDITYEEAYKICVKKGIIKEK